MRKINLPLTKNIVKTLRKGEEILLSGPLLTARDAAHKRIEDSLKQNKNIPVQLKGETIYYTGPTPTPKNRVIGSCGPTTSARMDGFTRTFLKHGLIGMIGKGERSVEAASLIKKYGAVYFVTIGGAGAYLSEKIRYNKLIAYPDLGAEAVYRLVVKDFPVIVDIV